MAQVQIRDEAGRAITSVAVRLSIEDQPTELAYDERFTDGAGNTAFPAPVIAPYYTLHVNYTDDCCGRGLRLKYEAISKRIETFDNDIQIILPQKGGHGTAPGPLTTVQLRGASIYGQGGDPEWDYRTFAHMLSDAGLNWTCWWLWGGWRDDGTAGSSYPFKRSAGAGSRWDLFAWNEAYFDRQAAMVDSYASYGVRCLLNIVDLYPWAQSKQGFPGIPDANLGPFRFNINGLRWGVGPGSYPDDPFYLEQPHGGPETGPNWLEQFIEKIVGRLQDRVDYQTGNECPESGLHDRIRDVIKRVCPTAKVSTSRNNDSPGQYANMVGTHHHDAINFHGWKDLDRMAEIFHEEDGTGRPKTYVELFASGVEPKRIVACSDGARSNSSNYPYDLPALLEAFRFAWDHGANVDHQSGAKMVLFNEGRHDLSFVETAFLRQLAQL